MANADKIKAKARRAAAQGEPRPTMRSGQPAKAYRNPQGNVVGGGPDIYGTTAHNRRPEAPPPKSPPQGPGGPPKIEGIQPVGGPPKIEGLQPVPGSPEPHAPTPVPGVPGPGGEGSGTSSQVQPDVRYALDELRGLKPGGELEASQIRGLGGDVRDWMAGMKKRAGVSGAMRGIGGTGAEGMMYGDVESEGLRKLAGGIAGIKEGGLDRYQGVLGDIGRLGLGAGGLQLGQEQLQRGLMGDKARQYLAQQQLQQNEREMAIRREQAQWQNNMQLMELLGGFGGGWGGGGGGWGGGGWGGGGGEVIDAPTPAAPMPQGGGGGTRGGSGIGRTRLGR